MQIMATVQKLRTDEGYEKKMACDFLLERQSTKIINIRRVTRIFEGIINGSKICAKRTFIYPSFPAVPVYTTARSEIIEWPHFLATLAS